MTIDSESIQRQIPFYLTAEDRNVLVEELKAISQGGTASYFLTQYQDSFKEDILQGDGWRGFQLFKFDIGERRSVKGLVLSNSCDIDPSNRRDVPTRVIFAPLVKFKDFENVLHRSKIDKRRIGNKLTSIREQKTSNVFFLPAGGPIAEDHIVRLDEIQSMPVSAHISAKDREKLFTLNNTGFYMLVFKLSIHFCRLHEKLNRRNVEDK